jgi:hypothetical protein
MRSLGRRCGKKGWIIGELIIFLEGRRLRRRYEGMGRDMEWVLS